ncbi:hypothetical protein B0H14DRAFT_2870069, partial [Mycena olivaceomarginata]
TAVLSLSHSVTRRPLFQILLSLPSCALLRHLKNTVSCLDWRVSRHDDTFSRTTLSREVLGCEARSCHFYIFRRRGTAF